MDVKKWSGSGGGVLDSALVNCFSHFSGQRLDTELALGV